MADIKFTGLGAVTPPINKGSLVATSSFDGATTYTSEKATISQLADAVFLMDQNQKITFDSSGTNKNLFEDSVDSYKSLSIDGDNMFIAMTDYASNYGGYVVIGEGVGSGSAKAELVSFDAAGYHEAGFLENASGQSTFVVNYNGVKSFEADSNGLGFFGTTPIAQPTGIAVTAGGIHAALVSLGLITA